VLTSEPGRAVADIPLSQVWEALDDAV
jgi:hypothetical protein